MWVPRQDGDGVSGKQSSSFALLFLLGAYLLLVVRNAWVGDDAYLTFRVVDNFFHGFGLRWNVSDRVQVFTSPLWTLLLVLAHFLTGDFYYTSIALSVGLSLWAAIVLVRWLPAAPEIGVLCALCLCLSRAYVDYSTSGLENPLTHLLLVLFAWGLFRGASLRGLALLAGLLALDRLDALLLVLPALVLLAIARGPGRALRDLALGFLPLALWTLVSIVYYGFPFPNTAYAKLATGIPTAELRDQGILYLLNSLSLDPLTLFVIGLALVASFRFREPFARSLALGIVLYLGYVVRIGGDFMSGRFLTAPFVLSLALLAVLRIRPSPGGLAGAVAGILVATAPTLVSSLQPVYSKGTLVDARGIADERLFYSATSALLSVRRGMGPPPSQSADEGREARLREKDVVVGGNGMYGLSAGPSVHVVDVNALSDAFLARLPAKRGWRIGHFVRAVPAGYLRELKGKPGKLASPELAAYLGRLRLVTEGPLFTWTRFRAIYDLNLGAPRHLLDAYAKIHGRLQVVPLLLVSDRRKDGSDPAEGGHLFSDHGISVVLPEVFRGDELEVSLENTEDYDLQGFREGAFVFKVPVPLFTPSGDTLAVHRLKLDLPAERVGIDEIRIFPDTGEDEYFLGHVRLIDRAEHKAAPELPGDPG